ncbi:MAG: hypothetical protein IKB74_00945, partial [Lentisphaeria bacterium]|nr:hypothetical protein [Lentisphaeria bacterium]
RSFPRLLDVKSIRAEVVRKDGTSEIIPVADDAKIFTVEKVPGNPAEKVTFIRCQESPWNSQFFRALGELVSFKKDAPYISFFQLRQYSDEP